MWLLQHETAQAIALALKAGLHPTHEERAKFSARMDVLSEGSGDLRVLTIAGDTAELRIEGTLTAKPDIIAFLLGGGNTTYQEITTAIARVAADPQIKHLELRIDSPGGQMTGLFEVLAALEAFPKKKSVFAKRAASAAFAIAALGGPITAANEASEFGSVGVVAQLTVDDETIDIASSLAPKKRPDPRTPEGKAIIVEYLDSVHELFADAIARGRGVKRNVVDSTFGRGATVLAAEAKKVGMINRIAQPAPRAASDRSGARAEGSNMNIELLKAEHPEVYAAVIAEGKASAAPVAAPSPPAVPSLSIVPTPIASGAGQEKAMDLRILKAQHPEAYEAAVAEGVSAERKRVKAHLNMGTQCGDMTVAVEAIASGADFSDPEVQSKYLGAGMNRADRQTRQAESNAAGAATSGAIPAAAADTDAVGEKVASAVEAALGIKKKGAA